MSESGKMVRVVPKRNKKIGLMFLLGPFVSIIVILVVYAIMQFALSTSTDASSMSLVVGRIVNVSLALLGILAVIGIVIGIPIGIIYLNKRVLVDGAKFDDRSGNKSLSTVPKEIEGWNWGAAGLTWIWGLSHSVWISLLTFIPGVNLIMIIVLGMKGNEWAWKAQKWESVEEFKHIQKRWMPWGVAFFVLEVLGLILNTVQWYTSV
ncbi:MAG: hypothetical protein AAB431_01235 [Patescibacteria group bacterium]